MALATDTTGISTTTNAAVAVLSGELEAGQGFWIKNTGAVDGFFRWSWNGVTRGSQPLKSVTAVAPFIAGSTGTVLVEILRITDGSNMTGVIGGLVEKQPRVP